MPVRQLLRFTLLWCGALASIALIALYLARIDRAADRREIYTALLEIHDVCLEGLLPTGEDQLTDQFVYSREHISSAITQNNPYTLGPSQETIDAYIEENARWGASATRLERFVTPTCSPYWIITGRAYSYVRFSHIGFNEAGDEALVTVEFTVCTKQRCPLGGDISLYFFRREHGTWREKQRRELLERKDVSRYAALSRRSPLPEIPSPGNPLSPTPLLTHGRGALLFKPWR